MDDLENVKAGDFLALWGGSTWGRFVEKKAVTRTTKAMVEVGSLQLNRQGRRRGASSSGFYDHTRAEPWNDEKHQPIIDEQVKAQQKARIVVRIDKFKFRDLSLEQLELFNSLLDQLEPKAPE